MNDLLDEKGLTLEQFLEQYKKKNYPRPYLTADCIIASKKDEKLYLLLIQRKNHPFINCYCIAGGFSKEDETTLQSAKRELEEETHLKAEDIKLLDIYSLKGRDPRGWVVSACYYGFADKDLVTIKGDDDAKVAKWFEVTINQNSISLSSKEDIISFDYDGNYSTKETLGFDHQQMIIDFLKVTNLI